MRDVPERVEGLSRINFVQIGVPILDDLLRSVSTRIQFFLASHRFALRERERVRTDTITPCPGSGR